MKIRKKEASICIIIIMLLSVVALSGCTDEDKEYEPNPEKEKGAYNYDYKDGKNHYRFTKYGNRWTENITIVNVDEGENRIYYECSHYYKHEKLAKKKFIGVELTLNLVKISRHSFNKDYQWGNEGYSLLYTDIEIESYNITGIDVDYITNRSLMLEYWNNIRNGLDFSEVFVDFSNAVDRYGAGMHTVYETTITITNPNNISTRLIKEGYNRSLRIKFSLPEVFRDDKFKLTFDGIRQKYEKVKYREYYVDGVRVYYIEGPKPFYIDLEPSQSVTYDISFEQFGTGPGVYKHGTYRIPIIVEGKSYDICSEYKEIGRYYINVKLGNGDEI